MPAAIGTETVGVTADVTDEPLVCNAALIRSDVLGELTAVAHLGPAMAKAARGVARAYEPCGVHVATITVGGAVAPGSAFDPDEIAEQYWRLHTQPRGAWEREVLYSGRVAPAGARPRETTG